MLDEVTLTDLARELGIDKRTLLRRLQPLDRELGGLVLRKTAKRTYVNRSALNDYRKRVTAAVVDRVDIVERVSALEHEVRELRVQVASLEARAS